MTNVFKRKKLTEGDTLSSTDCSKRLQLTQREADDWNALAEVHDGNLARTVDLAHAYREALAAEQTRIGTITSMEYAAKSVGRVADAAVGLRDALLDANRSGEAMKSLMDEIFKRYEAPV